MYVSAGGVEEQAAKPQTESAIAALLAQDFIR